MILIKALNTRKVVQISYGTSHGVLILLSSWALVLKNCILDLKYPNMLASILDIYLSIFHIEGLDLIWCLI